MKSVDNFNLSGKVFVKGKASEDFTCDRVKIKISFQGFGLSGAKASEMVTMQCEKFLDRLSGLGVDISKIQLEDDSIEQPYYDDDKKVKATRTLKFESEASATVVNSILQIIQEEHLDADLSTGYSLSNEDALRKTLRKKAIEDSKENAELLAGAAGKKIVGVDTIDMSKNSMLAKMVQGISVPDMLDCPAFLRESKKLSMPTKNIEEEVEVIWLIE